MWLIGKSRHIKSKTLFSIVASFQANRQKKTAWNDSTGYELEINPAQGLITLVGGGSNGILNENIFYDFPDVVKKMEEIISNYPDNPKKSTSTKFSEEEQKIAKELKKLGYM